MRAGTAGRVGANISAGSEDTGMQAKTCLSVPGHLRAWTKGKKERSRTGCKRIGK